MQELLSLSHSSLSCSSQLKLVQLNRWKCSWNRLQISQLSIKSLQVPPEEIKKSSHLNSRFQFQNSEQKKNTKRTQENKRLQKKLKDIAWLNVNFFGYLQLNTLQCILHIFEIINNKFFRLDFYLAPLNEI